MNDTNKKIQRCLTFIKDNVTDVDSIIDKLIEKDIIPLTERDAIITNRLPRDQIQSVIDVVTRKQKGELFISLLQETKNDHVTEKIQFTDITDLGNLDRSKTFTKESATTIYEVSKISKQLANRTEENEHLKVMQQELRNQLEDKVKRLKDLNAQLIENKKLYEKMEVENKELFEKNKEISELRHNVDDLKLQIEKKDEEITQLHSSLESVENELKRQKENQQEVTDRLRKDNQMLKTENEGIKIFQEKILAELSRLNANQNNTAQALTDLDRKLSAKIWMPGTNTRLHGSRNVGLTRTRRNKVLY